MRIYNSIDRWRKPVIWLSVIITLFMLFGFRYLKIESDIAKWLRQDVKEVKNFNYVSEKFGSSDIALVGILSDSIFTPQGIKFLANLQDSYEVIKGVSSVTSLLNILDIKGTEDGITVCNLIDRYNLPRNQRRIDSLRNYILSKDIYRGRIVSSDGKVTLFVLNIEKGVEKPKVAERIKKITESMKKKAPFKVKVYYSGTPMLLKTINSYILRDMYRLVPIVVLVVLIVLFIGMRSFAGVLLPLLVVLMSSIWSIGLMGYLGVPLSVVSNVMPALLIAIGTAYGIHVLSRYFKRVNGGESQEDAVINGTKEVFLSVVLAALTTMASFFSFLGTYVVSITQFGVFTGIGIFFAALLSLFLIPAILYRSNVRSKKLPQSARTKWFNKLAEGFAEIVVTKYRISLLIGIIILIGGIIGFMHLEASSNLLYYFPKNSEVRRSALFLREHFKGDIPVSILIRGDLKNPYILQEMVDFEKYMRKSRYIGYPNSYADLIVSMNDASFGYRSLPETEEQVDNLAFMLEGRPILSQLVVDDYKEGIINANATLDAYDYIGRYFMRNLDTVLVPVLTDTLSQNELEFLAMKTVNRILWDAEYRGYMIDTAHLADSLLHYRQNPVPFTPEDIKRLKEKINGFLSDEELTFPEVSRNYIVGLLADEKPDTFILKAYVYSLLPNSIKKTDPTYAGYILDNFLSFRNDLEKERKIERILSVLSGRLPEDAMKNSEFISDLKGDIYTFLKSHQALPSSMVKNARDTVKFSAVYTGLLPVEQKVSENLLKSQIKSMVIALFVVLILVSLEIGSLAGGVIASLPIILVIAINFGLMGLLGINLDSGTMLVASIAIGIGIDYAIHFIAHFREEVQRGVDIETAVKNTIHEKGHAILVNATTVGLGFLVLIFGTLVPIRNFGWLLFMTMLTSSILSLSFLPALILIFRKSFENKEVQK